ncbi:YceI family protein [Sphingomonas sp.]|uniref:YceI family protein n=1 Tax=Sphingomonas sp. TaxID=28214 RepID=UPI002600C8A5|nr:YceI family protein [Sphingomonas sp.]
MLSTRLILAAATLSIVVPVIAQTSTPAPAPAGPPGAPDASRVVAGSYKVDVNHTQVVWTLDHLGITPLTGAFGASSGTLEIDPSKLSAAKVNVTFNIADIATTSKGFTEHLLKADLFDVAKFTNASFTSTAVVTNGTSARVSGNLTIKGITKPVTLDMKFYGAGANPLSKKLQVGFSGTATIQRSDFGLGYSVPRVGDAVMLSLVGAFEKIG